MMHFQSPDQTQDDAQLLNALAAAYAGYSQFETALRFLDLSRHLSTVDSDANEIEVAILMKSGHPDRAVEKLDMLGLPLSEDMTVLLQRAEAALGLREKYLDDVI